MRGAGTRRSLARRRSGSPPPRRARAKLVALLERSRHEPGHGPCRAEGGANLAAFLVDRERERDDRDHHRVARADLHERLPGPVGRMCTAVISSSGSSAFRFGPSRKSLNGTVSRPCALEHKLGFGDQEGRERVPGRGGRAEVAADRAAVADLRAADGARGLCERGRGLCKRRFHRLGVGKTRGEPEPSVLPRPAAQLRDLVQVQERGGPTTVEVELHHHVGAALDRHRVGALGLKPQRLVQRPGGEDFHARARVSSPHARPCQTAGGGAGRRAGRPRRARGARLLGIHAGVARGRHRGRGRLRGRPWRLRGARDAGRFRPFVVPGFVDAHMHLESSKLLVDEFARLVLPLGTTTVVVDPHEIANVLGTDGVHWLLDVCGELPLDVYFMASSSRARVEIRVAAPPAVARRPRRRSCAADA